MAVIKQEVQDDDNMCGNDEDDVRMKKSSRNESSSPSDFPSAVAAALHVQQSKHFRQQQEEIVNRLHKAVSDNLKLINQGTESCNGNALDHAAVDQSCAANHNLNLNMNLSANSRFHTASTSSAARSFNGNSSEMKMCRLNKSKLSNSIVDRAQQLHAAAAANVTNDLFSCLLDNDDNNNSNSDLIVNDEGNNEGNYLLPCPLCEIPLEPRVFRQHLDRHYPRDSPICPVLQCGRRFAHPNSVRNHMRLKHTLQWNRMKSMRSSGGPFSSLPY